MAPSFEHLPPELLAHIVAQCETAKVLLNLSLTCRRFNHFVQTDGWRVFVQHRFPSFHTPPYWKDAAHGLTTWSRNWDRKAFVARCIEPYHGPDSRSFVDRHRVARRQTIGYQPVIDSYEEWVSGDWSSRREVIAWGAGAVLYMRLKSTGHEAATAWQAHRSQSRRSILDQHHHMHDWVIYKEPGLVDGKDDITSTNILRQPDKLGDQPEKIIVGRASGRLDCVAIQLTLDGSSMRRITRCETKKRPVRSATVSSASQPLLAACLGDDAIVLYASTSTQAVMNPLTEVSVIPPGQPGRTWSCRFLREDRLAVGRGPSGEPLLIYGIQESGFTITPVRKYEVDNGDSDTAGGSTSGPLSTSIYPITPIAPSSAAGGAEGNLFLSGGYDGNVRLHDLRSPSSSVAIFMDMAENSAIYSLLPLGRERFIAGASRYAMLKIFDLRMSGGKMYYSSDLDPCHPNPSLEVASADACQSGQQCCDYHLRTKGIRSNYNMYIDVDRTRSHRSETPVYSLSAPSPFSPTFYAGIEGSVVQFDVVSVLDRQPDPLFTTKKSKKMGTEPRDVVRKWDPHKSVMNLRVYEQVMGKAKMKTQGELHLPFARNGEKGWDERWR